MFITTHIKKRRIMMLFVAIFLSTMFISCGSSRGVFRKKKDCGCGTWSSAPQEQVIYADASQNE